MHQQLRTTDAHFSERYLNPDDQADVAGFLEFLRCDGFLLCNDRGALVFSSPIVVQRDIHEEAPFTGVETHNKSLGIFTADQSMLQVMDDRRSDLEAKACVIKRGHGVSNYHVRDFTDSLADKVVGSLYLSSGQRSSDVHRRG